MTVLGIIFFISLIVLIVGIVLFITGGARDKEELLLVGLFIGMFSAAVCTGTCIESHKAIKEFNEICVVEGCTDSPYPIQVRYLQAKIFFKPTFETMCVMPGQAKMLNNVKIISKQQLKFNIN